jgi:hypothetical protein
MIIVYGTKKVTNPQGYAADFCAICRDVVPVRIYRIGIAAHLYGVAYGKDETLDHTAQCQACKTLMPADFTYYKSILQFSDSLPTLIRRTSPRIYERCRERLEFERLIKEAPDRLPRKVRHDLVLEKFYAIEREVHDRGVLSRIDLDFLLVLAAWLGVALVAIPYFVHSESARAQVETYVLAAAACVLAYLWTTAHARYMRRHIYPKLSAALEPLKPTESELKMHLRLLGQRKLRIASFVNPRRLMQWLARNKTN